jgi:hypothetical protein
MMFRGHEHGLRVTAVDRERPVEQGLRLFQPAERLAFGRHRDWPIGGVGCLARDTGEGGEGAGAVPGATLVQSDDPRRSRRLFGIQRPQTLGYLKGFGETTLVA